MLTAMSDTHDTTPDQSPDEMQLALAALSSEVVHEIAHTRSFLRILSSDGADALLAGEDRAIAEHELTRIERLLTLLRAFKLPPSSLAAVPLEPALRLAAAPLVLRMEIPAPLEVLAESATLVMALKHLLQFVAAQSQQNEAEVQTTATDQEGLSIEIFCRTPNQQPSEPTSLLNLWYQAPKETGLLIAHRILRGFGWSVRYQRRSERTGFQVTVPSLQGVAP